MTITELIFHETDNSDLALLTLAGHIEPNTKRYETENLLHVLVSPPHKGCGWHLSISHPERYPLWDEIKAARNTLLPMDKTFAMMFPPQAEYINVHPNTFHLWQVVGKYREIDLLNKEAFS